MDETTKKQTTGAMTARQKRRRWASVFLCLAVVATLGTLAVLKLTGVAMTQKEKVLDCHFVGEAAHTHNDDCYDADGVLVCPLEERPLHTHDDSCYTTETYLVCGREESAGHQHSDSCYSTVRGDLVCGQDESEEHAHTDDCYEWYSELTCGISEGEGAHWHSDACYETATALTCGLEELTEEHVHGSDCFVTMDAAEAEFYRAEQQEEAGEPEDGSDPSADVEYASEWDEMIAALDLTGDWNEDLVTVAQSQLGYTESAANFIVDDSGEHKGYTRYGDWYGVPYGDWCAMFASFCLEYADIPSDAIPYEAGVENWIDKLTNEGMYAEADGEYVPKTGDLLFLDLNSIEGADHVGIIEAITANEITTIEGNSGNAVREQTYAFDSDKLAGFGVLPEEPEAANETAERPFDYMPAQMFDAWADNVLVSVYAPEGAFPMDTVMTVTPIYDDDVIAAATGAVDGEVTTVEAVDITFTYHGEEIEPYAPIEVTMTSDTVNPNAAIVHIDNDGEASVVGSSNVVEDQIVFEAASFSTYVIVGIGDAEAMTFAGAAGSVYVSVNAPAGAFADGTVMNVTSVEDEEILAAAAAAAGMRDANVTAVDITFSLDGVEVEPSRKIEVTLNSVAVTEDSVIVHVDDYGAAEVVDSTVSDMEAVFESRDFSIYAITDATTNPRLVYKFYVGNDLINTQYIKKHLDDNGDPVYDALYDPGFVPEYGQTFLGWAYDGSSTPVDIDGLNDARIKMVDANTVDGTEVRVNAVLKEAYYLRYINMDENGNETLLHTVVVQKDAAEADRRVEIDYQFQLEAGQVFQGWFDPIGNKVYSANLLNGNYDTVTLNDHLDLYLKLQGRYWLVFDSNKGSGSSSVTYTPPQLIFGNNPESVTQLPDDPVRKGYTFTGWNTKADGSGENWGGKSTDSNRFGGKINTDTTLYAQWEAANTPYYVVFWKQKATDTPGLADSAKSYDYVSSVSRTAKTDSTVSTTTADRGKGNSTTSDYGYYFTYNGTNSDTSATVSADGTTVLNVYYDRKTITYTFSGTSYQYTETTATTGTQYGLVNNNYVQLSGSGSTWTYNTTVQHTGTRYRVAQNNTNGTHYGIVNGELVSLTDNGGRYEYLWQYRNAANQWVTYNGTMYVATTDTSNTYTQYAFVTGTLKQLTRGGTNNNRTWSYTLSGTYTGTRYTRRQITNGSYTGLYGAAFNDWPDPGSGSVWKITTGTTTTSFPLPLKIFDPKSYSKASNTAVSLTFTVGAFDNTNVLTIYKQAKNGEWIYDSENTIATAPLSGSGTWTPTEKFTGYTIHGYRLGTNGSWEEATTETSIEYSSNLYLRYARNQYAIHFISQGEFVTERAENNVANIYYETDLSTYAKGGENYYEPTNGRDGYYFAGWYTDPACLEGTEFDFETTMPANDITLYAKWDTYRVRFVLVPTPNNAQNGDVFLPNKQALTFRLDYGETVKNENLTPDVVKRTGYTLLGWYTSPTFEEDTLWNFETPMTKEVTAVNMDYQSSQDWALNTYGDNDHKHDNVKGILKLYAKWALNVEENRYYIEYEVPERYLKHEASGNVVTTYPVDNMGYLLGENTQQVIYVGTAPTNFISGYTFKDWKLLSSDGSESSETFNAGNDWTVDASYISERTITDDLGNTATIKVITFRAEFAPDDEARAITVIYNGNEGVTNSAGANETLPVSLAVNENFEIIGSESFVRRGYKLVGWSFAKDLEDIKSGMTAAEFQKLANKDGIVYNGNECIGFLVGAQVVADNLNLSDLNTKDNTLYAVWEAEKFGVTVKQVVEDLAEGDAVTIEYSLAPDAESGYKGADKTPLTNTATWEVTAGENDVNKIVATTVINATANKTESAKRYKLESVKVKELDTGNEVDYDEWDKILLSDVEITYTWKHVTEMDITIQKVDGENNALSGAVFTLEKLNDTGVFENVLNTEYNEVTLNEDGSFTIGSIDIKNLPVGIYKLTETSAPTGYVVTNSTVYLELDGAEVRQVEQVEGEGGTVWQAVTENSVANDTTVTIVNTTGQVLPHTGGMGTETLTVIGLAMFAASALMLGFATVQRKRRAAADE